MTSNVAPHVPRIRMARWWFITTAVFLCGGLLALFIASHRNDAWVQEVRSRHCYAPPPLPDNRMFGWCVVGLIGVAVITLIAGLALFVIGQHQWWVKMGAVAVAAAFVLVTLWILLIGFLHTEAPGPPAQGIDGSGLPCPGG